MTNSEFSECIKSTKRTIESLSSCDQIQKNLFYIILDNLETIHNTKTIKEGVAQ